MNRLRSKEYLAGITAATALTLGTTACTNASEFDDMAICGLERPVGASGPARVFNYKGPELDDNGHNSYTLREDGVLSLANGKHMVKLEIADLSDQPTRKELGSIVIKVTVVDDVLSTECELSTLDS